jgi:hypothetical protein
MKKMKQCVMLIAMAGPTLFGMNCSTQVRDAAAAGVLDFITGSTTDILSAAVFPEPDPDPFQVELVDD